MPTVDPVTVRGRKRIGDRLIRSAAAGLLTGGLVATAPVAHAADPGDERPSRQPVEAATGRYIVVLEPPSPGELAPAGRAVRTRDGAVRRAVLDGSRVTRRFTATISGFAARMDADQLARVRRDPAVAWVEPDLPIRAAGTQVSPGWSLDRIDQRALPLDSSYSYAGTGAGVTAYVIDSGIRTTHTQFGGRASTGLDAVGDGETSGDCDGHGTHVAGTVGGGDVGVAKGVTLVAVRVLDCEGSGWTSSVIDGVDWVTAQPARPAVANMSLGGGTSSALDAAVARSIAAGITYAVAAGNESQDACGGSPARAPAALTVGASTTADAQASYSNHGSCLDLYAPGSGVGSAGISSDTATVTMSGTSMATPHVAGVAALYLQQHPAATPAQVVQALLSRSTTAALSGLASGSPNRLLYAPEPEAGSPTTPTTPPATGTPAGSAKPSCSAARSRHTGSMTRSRRSTLEPNAGSYVTRRTGWQLGCLSGPRGSDYDLVLYRKSGSAYKRVASATGTSSSEKVAYRGPAGRYRWKVVAYRGTGAYTLRTAQP